MRGSVAAELRIKGLGERMSGEENSTVDVVEDVADVVGDVAEAVGEIPRATPRERLARVWALLEARSARPAERGGGGEVREAIGAAESAGTASIQAGQHLAGAAQSRGASELGALGSASDAERYIVPGARREKCSRGRERDPGVGEVSLRRSPVRRAACRLRRWSPGWGRAGSLSRSRTGTCIGW